MDNRGTILAIDNDAETHTDVKDYLQREGYSVICESKGDGLAQDSFDRVQPDLVLLDVDLPDDDGFQLVSEIRRKTVAPIIIISKRSEAMDRIIGLEMGADDYVSKPFEMRELAARIKANLRLVHKIEEENNSAHNSDGPAKIKFAEWVLDLERYALYDKDDNTIDMTAGEIELLKALALSPRKALSRDSLFDMTRGRDYEGFDRAVDVQISRLRHKLGDDGRDPPYIRTVRGVGYMLDADTQILE